MLNDRLQTIVDITKAVRDANPREPIPARETTCEFSMPNIPACDRWARQHGLDGRAYCPAHAMLADVRYVRLSGAWAGTLVE